MPTPPPPLPRIALAGASGRLGLPILRALLSPAFLPSYSSITLLQLPTSKPPSILPSPIPPNIHLRSITPTNPLPSLHSIDVLISAVGPSGHAYKDALALALPSTEIKLYIPSEFGVDHTAHDFAHAEWDHKKAHYDLLCPTPSANPASSPSAAPTATPGLRADQRVQRVYVGLFLEESVGPWFGMDPSRGRYESAGSPDRRVSYTSLGDAARVVAQLCRMRMGGAVEEVRVAGDTRSMREVAAMMLEAQVEAERQGEGEGEEGVKEGKRAPTDYEIVELPLDEYKRATLREGTKDPSKYLRFLMGEGKIDHSARDAGGLGNDNELVNPSETLWRWKTMSDYAAETKGRPWEGVEFDASSVQ